MKGMVFYLSLKDTWKFDRNGQVDSTGTAKVETKKHSVFGRMVNFRWTGVKWPVTTGPGPEVSG